MKRIAQIENQFAKDMPTFNAGDTVAVHYKIKEGDKERIQVFKGTVISRRGSGTGKSFTVRKVSSGIGVERVFPLYSPNIDKIERVSMGRVRRAKLYYLRGLTGKSARIKTKLTEKGDKTAKAAAAPEPVVAETPAPVVEPTVDTVEQPQAEKPVETDTTEKSE